MGITYADITLVNATDDALSKLGKLPKESVRSVAVRSMVDSGAFMLTINEAIKNQLGLLVQEMTEVSLADGSCSMCEIVGPVNVHFKNRRTCCEALVLPQADEVLLGAIPLEGMDVMIDPRNQELILPPDRPYVSRTICK